MTCEGCGRVLDIYNREGRVVGMEWHAVKNGRCRRDSVLRAAARYIDREEKKEHENR
jgi:hypothetical protein